MSVDRVGAAKKPFRVDHGKLSFANCHDIEAQHLRTRLGDPHRPWPAMNGKYLQCLGLNLTGQPTDDRRQRGKREAAEHDGFRITLVDGANRSARRRCLNVPKAIRWPAGHTASKNARNEGVPGSNTSTNWS